MRGSSGFAQRLLRLERAAPPTRTTPGGEHATARAHPRGVCPQPSDLWQPTAGSSNRLPGRRNRIARLMRAERFFARQRSKYRVATTDSDHGGPIAPNRLRGLAVKRPNQVWTTDATCVLTGQGWLYLVAVLDVFTRRVIGWAMHQILDAQLVISALRMALTQRRPGQPLIIHSDRGAQFASAGYRQLLSQHGLTASMRRKGNCYDNAFIESFFSSLKYELVYHHRFATLAQARTAIFDYIETFYNRTRLHSSLAYQTPISFESQLNPNYPYLTVREIRASPL
jgi:putative transposase